MQCCVLHCGASIARGTGGMVAYVYHMGDVALCEISVCSDPSRARSIRVNSGADVLSRRRGPATEQAYDSGGSLATA